MNKRRTVIVAAGVVVLAASAGVTALVTRSNNGSSVDQGRQRALPTVTVTRGDLVQSQRVTGTVGYGSAVPVTASGSGTITWLPRVGAVVGRGEQLFRVDDRPVSLLYGQIPMYRTLRAPAKKARPATGRDVDIVARNLKELGFWDGPTRQTSYSQWFADAVEQWQESVGVAPSGTITPQSVVVARSRVRVANVLARTGAPADQDVLAITAVKKAVTLKAPSSLASFLSPGRRLRVALPDGSTSIATVTTLGVGGTASDGPPSLSVTVDVHDQASLDKVGASAVTADVVTATRRNVLRVPVSALLALAGGGYALERPDHRFVPVVVGMIADGSAEVSGVAAGDEVLAA